MASQVLTVIQQLMATTLWKPLLHSHVMMGTHFMGISPQAVKHQETGVNKHQHAEVMVFTNIIFMRETYVQ